MDERESTPGVAGQINSGVGGRSAADRAYDDLADLFLDDRVGHEGASRDALLAFEHLDAQLGAGLSELAGGRGDGLDEGLDGVPGGSHGVAPGGRGGAGLGDDAVGGRGAGRVGGWSVPETVGTTVAGVLSRGSGSAWRSGPLSGLGGVRSAAGESAGFGGVAACQRVEIEALGVGHLPVRGSIWAREHARSRARALGCALALVSVREGALTVELIGPPGQPPEGVLAEDAAGALRVAAGSGCVLVHVDSIAEPELHLGPVDRVTLLSGADEVATVASYGFLKKLAERFDAAAGEVAAGGAHDSAGEGAGEGAGVPALSAVVLGADAETAERAAERLRRSVDRFMDRAVRVEVGSEKIGGGRAQLVFTGRDELGVGEILRLLRSPPANGVYADSEPAAGVEAGEALRGAGSRPLLGAGGGRESGMPIRPTPVGDGDGPREGGLSSVPADNPGGDVGSRARGGDGSASGGGVAADDGAGGGAVERDRTEDGVMSSRVSALGVRGAGGRGARAGMGLDGSALDGLASRVGKKLTLLETRCPDAPEVRLLTDRRGRVHLVAPRARRRDGGSSGALRWLIAAETWLLRHEGLVRRAERSWTAGGACVLHLLTDAPRLERDLDHTTLRVHAVVRVETESGEAYGVTRVS